MDTLATIKIFLSIFWANMHTYVFIQHFLCYLWNASFANYAYNYNKFFFYILLIQTNKEITKAQHGQNFIYYDT